MTLNQIFMIRTKFFYIIFTLAILISLNSCGFYKRADVKDNPITVNSREELIEWVLNFHNSINKKLHRDMWTIEQLNDKYYH